MIIAKVQLRNLRRGKVPGQEAWAAAGKLQQPALQGLAENPQRKQTAFGHGAWLGRKDIRENQVLPQRG